MVSVANTASLKVSSTLSAVMGATCRPRRHLIPTGLFSCSARSHDTSQASLISTALRGARTFRRAGPALLVIDRNDIKPSPEYFYIVARTSTLLAASGALRLALALRPACGSAPTASPLCLP